MSPTPSSRDRLFIVFNGGKKTDPDTRKLIRSRVMLGKNCRKDPPDRPRDLETVGAMVNPDHQSAMAKCPVIPQKVGSDLAFISFPNTIDPRAATDAIKHAVIVARAKYVVDSCLIFDGLSSTMVEHLAADALFAQSAIFITQSHFNIMRGLNSTYPGQIHLEILRLLRERLSFGDLKTILADQTMFVVANLAIHAHMSGEDEAARLHLEGIRNIMDLRGGFNSVTQPKMLLDILRCDIGLALHTGARPLFFSNCNSQPYLTYPRDTVFQCGSDRVVNELHDLDADVSGAWRFIAGFCSLVNLAGQAQGKVPWELFLNAMASLMYRLLYKSFDASSIDEAIRLGLLALSSHIFLQWKHVRATYVNLSTSYRHCLYQLDALERTPCHLSAWLLMTGAASIFQRPDDLWLRPLVRANIESIGIKSWSEMREVLDSFLWVPLVQENSGKEFFDSVFKSTQGT